MPPRPPRLTNLTVRIDDQVLLWARMRALFLGISVNRLVTDFLEELADIPPDGKPTNNRPLFLRADQERVAQQRREADQRRRQRLAARDALEEAHAALPPEEPSRLPLVPSLKRDRA